jgi:putative endopeptidase
MRRAGFALSALLLIAAQLPPAPMHYGKWGIDLDARDPSVRPGDDFYRYANGAWLERAVVPPDAAAVGTIEALRDGVRADLRGLIEEQAARTPLVPADADGKVGAFYRAFMDEDRVAALGASPLARDLAAIRRARTRAALARLMGESGSGFHAGLFDLTIEPDAKAPSRNALELSQAGLGLPARDYYLGAGFARQRAGYEAYAAGLLALIHWSRPRERARDIIAFETAIAQASWPPEAQRDAARTYNPMSPAGLEKRAPQFPWRAYLAGAGLSPVKRVVVAEASAFPRIAAIFARTPIATLQAWQAFRTADKAAPYLAPDFVRARFDFRDRILSGRTDQTPRWRWGVDAVNLLVGWAAGDLFVRRYFPPAAKAQLETMVEQLRQAFARRIARLDWMTPRTKAAALAKLARIDVKIGYPDRPRDLSALRIDARDLYGNVVRSRAHEWRRLVAALAKPVDRGLWPVKPQDISAYQYPTLNEIGFPAAKLRPPYFDPEADPAVNFGAIGAVIGHELTHGFDDEGRHFDAEGRLRDWWQPADAAAFNALAAGLAGQYSAFEPLPGLRVNGALTLGEDIADLGGVMVALDAYHAALGGRPAPMRDGLSGDQRFFLAWAQVWREKMREAAMRRQILSDPHPPAAARVDVVLPNVDQFYSAFGIAAGDRLYRPPEQRIRIW